MFRHLGIDYNNTQFLDHTGRPMPMLPVRRADRRSCINRSPTSLGPTGILLQYRSRMLY